jgi:hypothetical protein
MLNGIPKAGLKLIGRILSDFPLLTPFLFFATKSSASCERRGGVLDTALLGLTSLDV